MTKSTSQKKPSIYEIQVSGRIDPERAAWFGEMALTSRSCEDGSVIAVLSGEIPDQAALFGILNRIRDLGMKLVCVKQIEPSRP
jgi:hypothetical protein